MNMFDEARSLDCMLKARKMTQKELAKSLGVSPSYVANKLRLLQHSEEAQRLICENGISERHARTLLRLDNEGERIALIKRIINEHLTAAETEAIVEAMHITEPTSRASPDAYKALSAFIDATKSSVKTLVSLGIPVKISERYYENDLYITLSIKEKI